MFIKFIFVKNFIHIFILIFKRYKQEILNKMYKIN